MSDLVTCGAHIWRKPSQPDFLSAGERAVSWSRRLLAVRRSCWSSSTSMWPRRG